MVLPEKELIPPTVICSPRIVFLVSAGEGSSTDCEIVGDSVGPATGSTAFADGIGVGEIVGDSVGPATGSTALTDGIGVGEIVGMPVAIGGDGVGENVVGEGVGAFVGEFVGDAVGGTVG